jgi:predicted RNase H-like HicB family nuclease
VIEVSIAAGKERRLHSAAVTHKEMSMEKDQFAALVGDGKASVSLAMSYADKDYGNGYEVRVSVHLSCNQDAATIDEARTLVLEAVRDHLEVAKREAEELYEELSGRG